MPPPSRRTLIAGGLTLALALLSLIAPLPLPTPTPVPRRIDLDARMFAFEPARLAVNQGDEITLVLHAEDVVHGLLVDGYPVNIVAEPGKPAEATFIADRLGKFRLRCSVTCGNLHPFMLGEMVVGPNLPFWRSLAALSVIAIGSLVTLAVHTKREA